LACSATTDSDGIATCALFDVHGHADHEDEDHGDPTVVTFAGVVQPTEILLPTTHLVHAKKLQGRKSHGRR
jgi:hypothetical protein